MHRTQIDVTPDNVYVNCIMPGLDNTIPHLADIVKTPRPAEFSFTRDVPLLAKASDYYCSIVRFTIPLDQVPIMVMPILPGCDLLGAPPAAPRNITPFVVSIRYNGVTYVQNIAANNFGGAGTNTDLSPNIIQDREIYDTLPIFQTNPEKQIVNYAYNYMYSYDTLISMVNQALAAAYAAFAAANPAAPQAIANVAPFFFFEPTTNLISLITHISWASLPNQATPDPAGVARVCMNTPLSVFFDGFRFIEVTDPIVPVNPQATIQIIVQDNGNNGYPANTYPAATTYLKTTQNYNIIYTWSSVRKIVITTNSIPIVAEAIPVDDKESGTAGTLPIISDFVPELTLSGDSKSIAYYNPTAQYRLADMLSDMPLRKIDLKVYWQDKDDRLYPLMIQQFNEASIKIAFLKKSLYKDL